jgi:hypothetical protein
VCVSYNDIQVSQAYYAFETWPMSVKIIKRLEITQRAMEQIMLGISLHDRARNTIIRKRTIVVNVGFRAAKLKWVWAGHLYRSCGGRWSNSILELGQAREESVGRPLVRWSDDIKAVPGRSGKDRKQNDVEKWRGICSAVGKFMLLKKRRREGFG